MLHLSPVYSPKLEGILDLFFRFHVNLFTKLLSLAGQAMGGTLSAVASVVDLAVANDVTNSALVYFLTADILILLCIVAYLLLPKLAYSRSVSAMLRCPHR